MEQTSFLPDNRPVLCRVLAWLPFRRESIEKIANGSSPAEFPQNDREPTWGLLYLSEESVGFYCHPAPEGQIAALFGGRKDSWTPIHLSIPFARVTGIDFIRAPEPRNRILRILSRTILIKEDIVTISWKGTAGNEAPSFSLRFFATAGTAEFERILREKSSLR